MDERERRLAQRVAQIVIEAANLIAEEQTLVDDGAGREGRHIEVGQRLQPLLLRQFLQRILGLLADGEQLALERVLILRSGASADKALTDGRHLVQHRLAQPVEGYRHVAPTQQDLAFLQDKPLKLLHGGGFGIAVTRQEAHGDAIIPGLRQIDARAGGPIAI